MLDRQTTDTRSSVGWPDERWLISMMRGASIEQYQWAVTMKYYSIVPYGMTYSITLNGG